MEHVVYPNPFSKNTTFVMKDSESSIKSLLLYNTMGGLVRSMSNIGKGALIFERKNLQPGIYFYEIKDSAERVTSGKLVLID